MYISTVKEADVLKHRGQVMDAMQKKDHNQLWLGLQNDRFDQFWSVNRRLMENTAERPFLHIPTRIYHPDVRGFSQSLVKPHKESNDLLTLGDFINDLNLEPPNNKPDKDTFEPRIVLHGVEPPLDTPLQWLSEHMSYPDNFLHLSVHWRKSRTSPQSTSPDQAPPQPPQPPQPAATQEAN